MFSIQQSDLLLGSGEWRNMQEVVRKSFKMCFDAIENQHNQIHLLKEEIVSLKTKLLEKPSRQELVDMVSNITEQYSQNIIHTEKEKQKIRQQITQMKTELDSKANIQHVENILGTKADKLEKFITLNKHEKTRTEDWMKVMTTMNDFKNKLDVVDTNYRSIINQNKGHVSTVEMKSVQERISDMLEQLSKLENSISLKQSTFEKDSGESMNHDISEIKRQIERLDLALDKLEKHRGDQEKALISWRNHIQSEQTSSSSSLPSPHDPIIRDIRDQSNGNIESLLRHIIIMSKSLESVLEREKANSTRLLKVEDSLTNEGRGYILSEQLDILSVVVEEQRNRLDSVITGSTIIPPIQRDLTEHKDLIDRITYYLDFPKPSSQTLTQDILSNNQLFEERMNYTYNEFKTNLSLYSTRLSILEKSQSVLDLRYNNLSRSNPSNQVKSSGYAFEREIEDKMDDLMASMARLKNASKETAYIQSRINEHEVRLVALEETSSLATAITTISSSQISNTRFKTGNKKDEENSNIPKSMSTSVSKPKRHNLSHLVDQVSTLSDLRHKKEKLIKKTQSSEATNSD